MRNLIITLKLILLSLTLYPNVNADTTGIKENVYTLGEVVISENVDWSSIAAEEIQKRNATNVGSALAVMPSLSIGRGGSRNESTLYIRGFDIRSTPIFIDGIPVYVPYDGYVDLARFTTHDLSRIDVSKGFVSMMYGANTIGGAINLISMKPQEPLEIDAKIGVMSGKGYDTKLNIGSNFGNFYAQGGLSMLGREYVPLSASFDTLPLQNNYRLQSSNQRDLKGSIKFGYSPNQIDEYAISYTYAHGRKGNPLYLGSDENTPVRYWDWPYWDKQSLYFISRTTLGENAMLKSRFFYDDFKNRLDSYDDATYTTQTRGYAFTSLYDDYAIGGNLELQNTFDSRNTTSIALHLKNDNHREHNEGEPQRNFADNTVSVGLEHVFRFNPQLSLVPGLAYHVRSSQTADDYNPNDQTISQFPSNTNDAINAQLGTFYRVTESFRMNMNVAYRTRFATMKDRYSYRAGRSIANPDLESESALSIEYSAVFSLGKVLVVTPELYYSRLSNAIQLVDNVSENLSQVQNTGRAQFAGADLSIKYAPSERLQWHTLYSYIQRDNLSNPEILFTNIPNHKLYSSVEYGVIQRINVLIFGEYSSARITTSDGSRIASAFFLFNSHLIVSLTQGIRLSMGVNNILDRNYTLQEGYPEAGRNIYMALYYNL